MDPMLEEAALSAAVAAKPTNPPPPPPSPPAAAAAEAEREAEEVARMDPFQDIADECCSISDSQEEILKNSKFLGEDEEVKFPYGLGDPFSLFPSADMINFDTIHWIQTHLDEAKLRLYQNQYHKYRKEYSFEHPGSESCQTCIDLINRFESESGNAAATITISSSESDTPANQNQQQQQRRRGEKRRNVFPPPPLTEQRQCEERRDVCLPTPVTEQQQQQLRCQERTDVVPQLLTERQESASATEPPIRTETSPGKRKLPPSILNPVDFDAGDQRYFPPPPQLQPVVRKDRQVRTEGAVDKREQRDAPAAGKGKEASFDATNTSAFGGGSYAPLPFPRSAAVGKEKQSAAASSDGPQMTGAQDKGKGIAFKTCSPAEVQKKPMAVDGTEKSKRSVSTDPSSAAAEGQKQEMASSAAASAAASGANMDLKAALMHAVKTMSKNPNRSLGDMDILDVAMMKGIEFPSPSWWRQEGYD